MDGSGGGGGGLLRKSYAEVIRNDNLDWALRQGGLAARQRAWPKQALYTSWDAFISKN